MHHFLALRLADAPRDRLAAVADRLRAWELPAQWVHPEDYHITVFFCGDCSDEDVLGIRYAVSDLAQTLVQPRLQLNGLGGWGGKVEPKIIYAACDEPEGTLAITHRSLAEALGMAPEPQYRPHVTLCRPQAHGSSDRTASAWAEVFAAFGQATWGSAETTHLVLYRSTTATPRYQAVEMWPLVLSNQS